MRERRVGNSLEPLEVTAVRGHAHRNSVGELGRSDSARDDNGPEAAEDSRLACLVAPDERVQNWWRRLSRASAGLPGVNMNAR
jgi:hypothetical protein